MYKVLVESNIKEIKAEMVTIREGNLLFFADKEKTKLMVIIPSGKWGYFEAPSEDKAIYLQPKPATKEEAPVVESPEDSEEK